MVMLLAFIVIGITITTGAVALIASNSINASKYEQGEMALSIAESGAEDKLLYLLRNPGYTGQSTLTMTNGTATVTIAGTGPVTITSSGQSGNFVRKIQVTAGYTNNILSITSWKEIF